ncbi:MAG: hypothetical protein F6K65_04970 [Moorea sp. SIO3C2]|nr:hypothetical protein [Moorena sp. SIO3C2]
MAASRFNAKNFPSLTPCVITENSRTVLPSPSFLAPRSGSGDFSSPMLLWSRYANAFCPVAIGALEAIDLGLWATLREWSRGARLALAFGPCYANGHAGRD